MTIANNPYDLLTQSAQLIQERGNVHGQLENNFQLISDLSSLRLGRNFHPFEICVILECVKDARMFANPTNIDNYLDGVNYKAFSALFAQDYVSSQAASGIDVSYKKKDDLKKAEMKGVEVKAKSGKQQPLAVDIAALDAEIRG